MKYKNKLNLLVSNNIFQRALLALKKILKRKKYCKSGNSSRSPVFIFFWVNNYGHLLYTLRYIVHNFNLKGLGVLEGSIPRFKNVEHKKHCNIIFK